MTMQLQCNIVVHVILIVSVLQLTDADAGMQFSSRKLEIIPVIGRLCFQMKHNCFLLFQTQNTEDIFEQRSSPNNKNKTKQYKNKTSNLIKYRDTRLVVP
jgi:hypothetical protein